MKYTHEEIEQKVSQILIENLGVRPDEVTPDARFVEDLSGDSLDCVETIMAVEEEFDLEIPDEDTEKLKTVGDVVTYIEQHTKAE